VLRHTGVWSRRTPESLMAAWGPVLLEGGSHNKVRVEKGRVLMSSSVEGRNEKCERENRLEEDPMQQSQVKDEGGYRIHASRYSPEVLKNPGEPWKGRSERRVPENWRRVKTRSPNALMTNPRCSAAQSSSVSLEHTKSSRSSP
jgi:hypothetical protein